MNNNLPLVSIVVASYNNGQYLEECLESAVNQTYQNIEIIIADDYSTDNSREIIGKFIIKYPDKKIVPVFNEKNMGACNSINNAIFNYCSGEWIKFLDSDDYLILDCIELLMLDLFESKGDVACIYGKTQLLENGVFSGEFGTKYNPKSIFNGKNMIPTCSSMVNLNKFRDVGGFLQDGYVGDFYIWYLFTVLDFKFLFTNKVVSCYRVISSNNALTYNKNKMIFSHLENLSHIGRVYNCYDICMKTMMIFIAKQKYYTLIEINSKNKINGFVYYIRNLFFIFKATKKNALMFPIKSIMRYF